MGVMCLEDKGHRAARHPWSWGEAGSSPLWPPEEASPEPPWREHRSSVLSPPHSVHGRAALGDLQGQWAKLVSGL